MRRTKSSSLLRPAAERLIRVPLADLHRHPLNANLMSDERLDKLATNIARDGRYPPLVVRPHPEIADAFQVLDGHQRLEVLQRLGHDEALCFSWPCDDATALLLLATLNRLEGEDVPALRAALLDELRRLVPEDELALLLPESAAEMAATLSLLDLDSAALLADLEAAAQAQLNLGPRLLSFAVDREDEADIEAAITTAMSGLSGPNRRGQALALICRAYAEIAHA